MLEGEDTRRQGAGSERWIGTAIDKYTVVRLIGSGGMGVVYEARHAQLARRFAVKFLLPEFAASREILKRFENEAKAAGGLEHPNLAAVTDLGRASDGLPYMVMEFLDGQDCAKLLRSHGRLPVSRAVDIVLQSCRGLAVAHRAGIVHRDLKPENLFLTDAGDGSDLIKVLDFGIAKLRSPEATSATGTGATFGTAHYMSPEQARGAGDVDERTDIWALGVVLYEMLGGRKPFEGDQFLQVIHQILNSEPTPLAQLRPGLPRDLVAAVERAMSRKLADRWSSMAAFAEALAPFGGRSAVRVPAAATLATPPTGPIATSSTRSSKAVLAGGLVAITTVGMALFFLHERPARFPRNPPAVVAPSTHQIAAPLPQASPIVGSGGPARSATPSAASVLRDVELPEKGARVGPDEPAKSLRGRPVSRATNSRRSALKPVAHEHDIDIETSNPYQP